MSSRGGFAHRTALGCFLATLASATPVVNATFGLFLLPVSRDLHWPRSHVSLVLVVLAFASALCFPVAGRLADRFGARRVVLAGAVAFPAGVASLSLLGAGAADSLFATILLFALLGLTAALFSAPLFARLVSGWFFQRRGLALGLVAGAGNGIGCVLMPALAGTVIADDGWRAAYLVLGVAVFAIALPSVLLLVRDPSPAAAGLRGPTAPDREVAGMSRAEAMRTRLFWLILLLLALGAGSLTAMFTHVAPILLDRGLSPVLATGAVSVVALAGSVWQPAMGYVLDRTGDPRWLVPGFLAAVLGLPLLAAGNSAWGVLSGAALVGVAIGSDYAAIPLLVGRYFGLRAFGAISGTLYGINVVVLGIAPFLADLVFDRTGSYRITLVSVGLCLLCCAACCSMLPRFTGGITSGR